MGKKLEDKAKRHLDSGGDISSNLPHKISIHLFWLNELSLEGKS